MDLLRSANLIYPPHNEKQNTNRDGVTSGSATNVSRYIQRKKNAILLKSVKMYTDSFKVLIISEQRRRDNGQEEMSCVQCFVQPCVMGVGCGLLSAGIGVLAHAGDLGIGISGIVGCCGGLAGTYVYRCCCGERSDQHRQQNRVGNNNDVQRNRGYNNNNLPRADTKSTKDTKYVDHEHNNSQTLNNNDRVQTIIVGIANEINPNNHDYKSSTDGKERKTGEINNNINNVVCSETEENINNNIANTNSNSEILTIKRK